MSSSDIKDSTRVKKLATLRRYKWLSTGGSIFSLLHKGTAMITDHNELKVREYAKRHGYAINKEDTRIFMS